MTNLFSTIGESLKTGVRFFTRATEEEQAELEEEREKVRQMIREMREIAPAYNTFNRYIEARMEKLNLELRRQEDREKFKGVQARLLELEGLQSDLQRVMEDGKRLEREMRE